jgi:hypothetical protein
LGLVDRQFHARHCRANAGDVVIDAGPIGDIQGAKQLVDRRLQETVHLDRS